MWLPKCWLCARWEESKVDIRNSMWNYLIFTIDEACWKHTQVGKVSQLVTSHGFHLLIAIPGSVWNLFYFSQHHTFHPFYVETVVWHTHTYTFQQTNFTTLFFFLGQRITMYPLFWLFYFWNKVIDPSFLSNYKFTNKIFWIFLKTVQTFLRS